jgi:rhamnose utilization protein RhaD (predicted bifunctional aldolase and dehydrogenase)/NAD(P)-dependent dehydrogenase (short-subunit alcohol dehydrogenase family)
MKKNSWSNAGAAEYVAKHGKLWGEDLALRTYLSLLIGSDDSLVLHGGGNSSLKTRRTNIMGENVPVIFVKASGHDMAAIEPNGYTALDLEYLRKLRGLAGLSDEAMTNEFLTHMLDSSAATPSIETLVHAFLPQKFIDHTHADAILALSNQTDGESRIREALGPDVLVLCYIEPGFKLAKAAVEAYEARPGSKAMVWMKHGLVTWGETAAESYESTVELISRAEEYLARNSRRPLVVLFSTPVESARERLSRVAPVVRGVLASRTDNPDQPYQRVILQPLIDRETLDYLASDRGRELALSPALTADHLIRTKPLPLWIDNPQLDDPDSFRKQVTLAVQDYAASYNSYVERNRTRVAGELPELDSLPRVVLIPGVGALCAGKDVAAAAIARDITAHTLAVKSIIASMGSYEGLAEGEIFEMEYRGIQRAKLGSKRELPLARRIAIVTGAAGAIGSAVAEEFLCEGCHVAITDLAGANPQSVADQFKTEFGRRVVGIPMDVTDPESVARAFDLVTAEWGGVDLVVVNAGVALVSPLQDMTLESFRHLEKVNIEGTLLVLAEASRRLRLQGTGGDVVVISTKNVFSPGAKFGAYSATKAAAHQLARIASIEFAEIGVRVNMVAPDAVFSHGSRRSGLWESVGPDRMRARGLDVQGLEEYYRNRNLLKLKITGRHVARAALFFATRQTPTTGATLPVDGGLPDATPR